MSTYKKIFLFFQWNANLIIDSWQNELFARIYEVTSLCQVDQVKSLYVLYESLQIGIIGITYEALLLKLYSLSSNVILVMISKNQCPGIGFLVSL